jgi:hypothetical protein
MTLRRLAANLLAGIVLVLILVGLVIIMVDERCSKNVSESVRERSVQAIPFAEGRR